MHWFYAPEINRGLYTFDQDESKHITRVLRLKKDDKLFLTNGRGSLFSGKILDDHPKKCVIDICEKVIELEKRPFGIHIAVAPTKNVSRIEWFVEKATEFGIAKITLMQCDHSERMHINCDRLRKISIAAIKQSQQVWLPEIQPFTNFSEVIKNVSDGEGFIAFLDEEKNHAHLKHVYKTGSNATVLIGPEGDFSKTEIAESLSAGFIPISLGENRLRTETAALAACFTINLINQK